MKRVVSWLRGPSNLPLGRDSTTRFLPWLIAVMVFLAALAVALVTLLEQQIHHWNQEASGHLTVQVVPVQGDDRASVAARTQEVQALLAGNPHVARADILPPDAVGSLLEPWLSGSGLLEDLPLPFMIDVRLHSRRGLDLTALNTDLQGLGPSIHLDDHNQWLQDLIHLAHGIAAVGFVILVCVALATAVTVVHATRTGLAVHHDTIEILHVVGAPDRYVAREFARHAARLGALGGLYGVAGAAVLLLILQVTLGRGGTESLLPELGVPPLAWVLMALLPLFTGLLAAATAHATVMRTLRALG